jgi:DNA-directed RNA polymerase specialized sigma24 family protein
MDDILTKALAELDDITRQAVVMRDVLNSEYPDIALNLGLDETQARNLVTQARGRLADLTNAQQPQEAGDIISSTDS